MAVPTLFDLERYTIRPIRFYSHGQRDPWRGTRVEGQAIHCSTCGSRLFNRECVIDTLGRVTVYCRRGHKN